MTASTTHGSTQRFTAARVRQDFLDFFAQRGHAIVPSSPVFPKDDPTLLFTNAGMNQFKDVFLGTGTRPYKRAADTQKCIRVSGKHNDLEEVGVDTYHHTFFEMLGNWSFGDYFKEDAITWAWTLLTEVWGLPKDRLWVTVFGGDEKDGLPADVDAERIWIQKAGVDPKRVLRFGRKANFWEMGETGPCGPCTEIHFDRGGPGTNPMDGADPKHGVNTDDPRFKERFIELWNNVFMEFNRLDDGRLAKLPAQSVDTGMGFERILSVLQGKRSNYDTDLFTPIFARIEELSGRKYGATMEPADIAFRVIADHTRAVTSAISDGATPSNEGRGYVLRRLIRRASRFGRQNLGMKEPFLCQVVPAVAQVLGDTFPEMRARAEHVGAVLRAEEEQFGRTLDRGLGLFADLASKVEKSGAKTLPGAESFELYATYGFPQDLVELMARERGLGLDTKGWDAAMEKHQAASRSEGKFKQLLSAEQLTGLTATRATCHEDGPRTVELDTKIAKLFRDGGAKDRLVLTETPFYAESGGQVGDAGAIRSADGGFVFTVEDTQKVGDVVVHVGKVEKAPAGELTNLAVKAVVDRERRDATRANHTATHLLHKVLKEVVGEHVQQMGSYVGPDRLRFDFSNPQGLAVEQLDEIERRVNAAIARNDALKTTVEDLAAAKARGVVALFGEKYSERVRVVDVGGFSTELCGGTHVRAAGDIGPFVIVSERAIQAGVRRIEALTRRAAVDWMQEQRRLVRGGAQALKCAPEEIAGRIEALQKELKDARKKNEQSSAGGIAAAFETVKGGLVTTKGVAHGVFVFENLDQKSVRELTDRAKGLAPVLALSLFGREGDKVAHLHVVQGVPNGAGLKAGDLANLAKTHVGGGGGGSPALAQGQGTNPAGLGPAKSAIEATLAAAFAKL